MAFIVVAMVPADRPCRIAWSQCATLSARMAAVRVDVDIVDAVFSNVVLVKKMKLDQPQSNIN